MALPGTWYAHVPGAWHSRDLWVTDTAHETKNPENSMMPGSYWAWEGEPRLVPYTRHRKFFLQLFLLVLLILPTKDEEISAFSFQEAL